MLFLAVVLTSPTLAQPPATSTDQEQTLSLIAPDLTSARRQDEHSYAEPGKVAIRAMALDLKIDFEKRELAGTVIHRLRWNKSEAKDTANNNDNQNNDEDQATTLVLDTRALTIEKVQARNGNKGRWKTMKFSLDAADSLYGSRLTIALPEPYTRVRISYRTSPDASGLQWLTPSMTSGGKIPFMFSQSQAIHARSWVPLQDTPSVRFTYTARIRTPADVIALMSADNDPQAKRDGDYRFMMPQPISSYLLAIAAGDLTFKAISSRSGVWAEPAMIDRAITEFEDTEKMIAATEALYGEYRWGRYDLLILPPSFPFGGMENPRLSFITPTVIAGDKSLVSLIAHELAHSWSGNLVTNASWKDMWLNEGFTSYVENRIVESLYGNEQAQMENVIAQNGLKVELKELPPARQLLALPATPGGDPEDALSDVAYVKGQWFLIFLEQRFGRELFDPFLRSWFDAYAFQTATTDDFVAFLRGNLMAKKPDGISDTELNIWINEPGIPVFAPLATSERFDKIDKTRSDWLKQKVATRDIKTDQWITQEWIYFLEGMPEDIDAERLVELDSVFRFTGTTNGELAQRWYPMTVRAGYFEARPAMAQFLKKIGRRKLIMPTYTALVDSQDGLAFAKQVFEQAQPGYHPITRGSVQALFDNADKDQ